jgi:hypothetical protein
VVFEQMLTVFFAAGVGVAIVLYAARSRRSVAPSIIGQGAAVQASPYVAAETIQASAADAPVVEASSVSHLSQIVNDIPSTASEVATPTEAAAVVAAPVEEAMASIIVEPTVTMESQASQAVSATTAAEASAQTTIATTEKPRRVRSTRRRSSGTASTRTRARTATSQKTTEQTTTTS